MRLFADVVVDGGYLEVIVDPADPAGVPPRPDLRRWLEPLGPVLVFAASNFPFAFSVLGGDTASALAAGCPVVVKAHSSHPGLSAKVAALATQVVAQQGLPAGVFSAVFGDDAGLSALNDSRVRPFYGELGSINPAVVTPAAAAARGAEIARGFVASMTLGTGQFCTKPGLLFLPVGHAMTAALSEAVAGTPAAPMLNERIRSQLARGRANLTSPRSPPRPMSRRRRDRGRRASSSARTRQRFGVIRTYWPPSISARIRLSWSIAMPTNS